MADQTDHSPDLVLAANLVDRLSCAVDYDSTDETQPRKHYPCLRDDLGDLHHDLLDAPNGATARVVKVVADAERAARIDELKRLLVGQETSYNLRTDEARHYVKSTVIEARIAELEAENV